MVPSPEGWTVKLGGPYADRWAAVNGGAPRLQPSAARTDAMRHRSHLATSNLGVAVGA